MREAEANKVMLTPQYLDLKFSEAIANNTKIFFGNRVWPILFFFFFFVPCDTILYFTMQAAAPELTVSSSQVPNMVLDQRLMASLLHDDGVRRVEV